MAASAWSRPSNMARAASTGSSGASMCVTFSTAVPRPGKKKARPPRRSSPNSSPRAANSASTSPAPGLWASSRFSTMTCWLP
jgi:hypothetical protein